MYTHVLKFNEVMVLQRLFIPYMKHTSHKNCKMCSLTIKVVQITIPANYMNKQHFCRDLVRKVSVKDAGQENVKRETNNDQLNT